MVGVAGQVRARSRKRSRSAPVAAADRAIRSRAARWKECQRYQENGAKWPELRARTAAYRFACANPCRWPSLLIAAISAVSASGPSSG